MANERAEKTYEQFTSWKSFQGYFPEEYRISSTNFPIESFWDWTDYKVHLDRYLSIGEEKKTKIILIHGGGGNGRLLSPIGVAMSSRGFECVAPDLPGFGLTVINAPNSYDTWVDLVVDLIAEEHKKDGKPILLCGISLGGMLCYHAACRSNNVTGLMVSSLADTTQLNVQMQLSRNKVLGKSSYKMLKSMSKLTDTIKVPIKATTKMWAMANNQEFVRLLKKDKVGSGSWVYLKFFRTLFEAKAAIEPEAFTKCPLLFFQPEKDFIIPWEISKPYYDRLACEKEVVFLENCGHIPLEEPGINQLRERAVAFIDGIEQRNLELK
jgi:alpha-beta hydrolase superfamily lysophospholipase